MCRCEFVREEKKGKVKGQKDVNVLVCAPVTGRYILLPPSRCVLFSPISFVNHPLVMLHLFIISSLLFNLFFYLFFFSRL